MLNGTIIIIAVIIGFVVCQCIEYICEAVTQVSRNRKEEAEYNYKCQKIKKEQEESNKDKVK